MRKIFTFLFAALMSVGMFATTVVTITDSDFPKSGNSFTTDGVTVSAGMIDSDLGNLTNGGSFSTTLGNFTEIEVTANDVGTIYGLGWNGTTPGKKTWKGNAASSVSFNGNIRGMGMGVTLKFTIAEPAPAIENSITINGTPQVGDNSISLTYYFDPANVPGICCNAPTLKVKCAADNQWDEKWLSLNNISSGTTTITLDELGSFQEGKSYDVCFAYNNGSWVDEVFQSFTPAAATPEPEPEPQPTTVTWGATEFSSFGVDYLHDSRTVKGITVTVNAATNNFINVTEYGTTFNATIDNAFTFSTELGNFTKIECTTLYANGTLGDGWTIGANSATWEGNTNTLNFGNAGSMLVVSNIIFTIGGGSTPAPAEDVNITPNVDPENPTVYYSTFYDSANKYALPAGVEAYVADLSGANLLLTKIAEAGEVIPANVAVILKATVTPFTLTPSDADAVTFTATNDLQGSDTQIATPANCYVLAGTDGVVGFYHYTAANLNAHKAYVVYSGSNQAPRRMPFIFDQATGVENVQGDNVQSTKVIENGVLYIIKNGVKFNAQGQVVK